MKKDRVIKIREPQPIAINSPAELIRSTVTGKGNLQDLKELLAIQRDWEANEAKKAYYKAMTLFKASIPQIEKNKKVKYAAGSGQVNYAYATLFNAVNKVTPEMSKYGLSVAWFHKQTEKELTVTCRITHELGYHEETSLTGPHDCTGSKNAIQALGSTNSYLERYTLFALIGAAAKDQDDDGQSATTPVEYLNDKERSQILDYLAELNRTEKSFCTFFKIDSIDKLPKSRFQAAINALESARKGK